MVGSKVGSGNSRNHIESPGEKVTAFPSLIQSSDCQGESLGLMRMCVYHPSNTGQFLFPTRMKQAQYRFPGELTLSSQKLEIVPFHCINICCLPSASSR